MKLYARLMGSGIFIFWDEDDEDVTYNLKVSILINDTKIKLFNMSFNNGQNYYSFDRVGTGDYEIELLGLRDGKIYHTDVKKVKLVTSVQKSEEQINNITDKLSSMEVNICAIRNIVDRLEDLIYNQEELARIKHNVNYYLDEKYNGR